MKKLSYNFFDLKTVHVHSSSTEILEEIDKLFVNFRNNEGKPLPQEEHVYLEEINEREWKYMIVWNDVCLKTKTLYSHLLSFNHQIINNSPFLFVHASVVSHNSDVLIFMGDSNYGKSTLSFALISKGFKYLSDEYVVFDLSERRILPYPRCGLLTQKSLFLLSEVHESFSKIKFDLTKKKSAVNPLKLFPLSIAKTSQYKRLFFFIIKPIFCQKVKITPTLPIEVYKNIILNSRNLSQVYQKNGEVILNDLYGLIRKSYCFHLRQGKPANTVKTIKTILKNAKRLDKYFPVEILLQQVKKRNKM